MPFGGMTVAEDRDVTKIPVSQFARRVRQVMDQALERPVELTKNGEPVAVLVDIERYREFEAQEEVAEDLYWTAVAMRQHFEWLKAGKPTVSYEEVVSRTHGGD